MAAVYCEGEVEDLITCPICLCEYDEVIENRKPKFLSCSHTVCLQCLKGLQNSFLVSCPLCRKTLSPSGTLDIASVPTNTYALCILKMAKGERKPAEPVEKKPSWFLTCGSIGKIDCPTLHSTLDMTAHTMSNFESLLAVKERYAKVKEPIRFKLESAVEKEKELQSYLDRILQTIKSLQIEITKLDEESKLRLAGMVSQLDSRLFSAGSKEEENDAFLSELFSLVNSSQPEETLETLIAKMEDSFKEIEINFKSSESVSELPVLVNSTKISVKLFSKDDSSPLPCPTFLESGFASNWKTVKWNESSAPNLSHTSRDQLLLSHLISSIRKRHGIKNESPPIIPPPITPAIAPSTITSSPITPPLLSVPRPKFILNKSIFILTLKKSHKITGKIHFCPTAINYPIFVQHLGDFCFGNSRPINSSVGKAISEVYVNIPLSMNGFQPTSRPANGPIANKPLDVGLIKLNEESTPKWGLIFMLDKCQQPNFKKHLKPVKSALLFGRIVEGQNALIALSGASNLERSNYAFTLESRTL